MVFPQEADTLPFEYPSTESHAYALKVKGKSMIEDAICDGDYVVIAPQATYCNGETVVALHLQGGVQGSATLKRFFREADHVRLQPANAQMEPLLIPQSTWDREWVIQGKVVAIFRHY